jgi:hypothetical protein
MKQFVIKSTVLTFIVLTLGAIVYSTVFKSYYLSVLPFAVLFFYAVINLVHAWLLKISEKSSARFTSRYMAVSFLKMFFYLACAIVYVIFDRLNAKIFIANFLLLYLVYTSFEVYEFAKVIRPNRK